MTNKELPEGYEDALTRLLRNKEDRVYNRVAHFVHTITDITVRLELARIIKGGVDDPAVTSFLNWMNQNLSHESFAYFTTSLPLTNAAKFKEYLAFYFNIPQEDTTEGTHFLLWQLS